MNFYYLRFHLKVHFVFDLKFHLLGEATLVAFLAFAKHLPESLFLSACPYNSLDCHLKWRFCCKWASNQTERLIRNQG